MDHRCCVDSVGNWMDGMHSGGMVGKSMVGKGWSRVDGVGCQRNNCSVANGNYMVGAHRGLDFDETLGVVCLADGGVGCTKGFRLHQASLLTVGSCHCLVGGLPTNSMVGKSVVSKAMVGKSMVGKSMVGKSVMTHKKGRLS